MASAFIQFEETRGNSLIFRKLRNNKDLNDFIYRFSFRLPERKRFVPLNSRELTSLYHFPSIMTAAPRIKFLKAKDSPHEILGDFLKHGSGVDHHAATEHTDGFRIEYAAGNQPEDALREDRSL